MSARRLAPLLLLIAAAGWARWHAQAEEPPPPPWERVVGLIDRAAPSVVRVEVVGSQPRGDQPLRRLFRRVETRPGAAGLVVDARLVLTHASLVRYADPTFTLTTTAGTRVQAQLRHLDSARELAVLEAEVDLGVPALPLGPSAGTPAGSLVVALGDPFGTARDAQPTASLGVLEGRIRLDAPESTFAWPVLLTDAAVNPGSEGGPLLDLEGRVLGILAPLAEDRRTGTLHGHAIPAEAAAQVLRHARRAKPLLGFHVRTTAAGLEVAAVDPEGPAAAAGVRVGDLLVAAGGQPIKRGADLRQVLREAGATLALRLRRDGEVRTVEVRLGGAR